MAWFVVAGAVAAGMYAADRNKTVTCTYCKTQCKKREFVPYHFDGQDEEKFAVKWLRKKLPLCAACGQRMEEAYKTVLKNLKYVEVYPIDSKDRSYAKRIKGKVPVEIDSKGYCDSKEEALKELKINALLHRSNTVTDVYYDYTASIDDLGRPCEVWIAKGTAHIKPKEEENKENEIVQKG
ncbi:MAG: hypothetical protein IKO10_05890 [Lachnospiraceae bacterium]|nr:hypothetical protein [Lachnospiraceae bacterium]